MARPLAATTDQLTPPENRRPGFSFEDLPDGDVEVQDLTNGLVTNISRDKRPPGSFQELTNARVRRNFVLRRGGHAAYGAAQPDANQILKIVPARLSDDVDWIVRVSLGSIYATSSEALWAVMTTTGTQYTEFLRMTYAQFLDDIYLANLEKPVTRLVFSTMTFEEVEQAPVAKFVTTFAERIVAAYIVGNGLPETTQIAWSANADPLTWDPLDDLTAGLENLVTSPSDTGDEITGLFAFGQNLAVILRERSIWHITRQPYGIAPFRFTPVITDIGCDMPYTAVRTPRGIVFADFRTKAVWLYAPGSAPQRISTPIDDILFEDLVLKQNSEAVYIPDTQEYILSYCTSDVFSNRLCNSRIFNMDVNAWSIDDSPVFSTQTIASKVGLPTMIDDLVGMIDGLVGTIDELSTQGDKPPILLRGDENGRILQYSQDYTTDPSLPGPLITYDAIISSQDLVGTRKRRKLKELLLISDAEDDGDEGVIIRLSKNGGAYVTKKTYLDINTASRTKVGLKRNHVVGDKVSWQIETDAKNFKLHEWSAKLLQKGPKELVEE